MVCSLRTSGDVFWSDLWQKSTSVCNLQEHSTSAFVSCKCVCTTVPIDSDSSLTCSQTASGTVYGACGAQESETRPLRVLDAATFACNSFPFDTYSCKGGCFHLQCFAEQQATVSYHTSIELAHAVGNMRMIMPRTARIPTSSTTCRRFATDLI